MSAMGVQDSVTDFRRPCLDPAECTYRTGRLYRQSRTSNQQRCASLGGGAGLVKRTTRPHVTGWLCATVATRRRISVSWTAGRSLRWVWRAAAGIEPTFTILEIVALPLG